MHDPVQSQVRKRGLTLPVLERGGGIRVGPTTRQAEPKLSKLRLYRSSPIARKIVLFNLLAQGLLVIGLIFLNQYERSLLDQRERGLIRDGALLARTLSSFAGDADTGGLNIETATDIVLRMGPLTDARVRLFNRDLSVLADSQNISAEDAASTSSSQSTNQSAVTAIFDQVVFRLASLLQPSAEGQGTISQDDALEYVAQAMQGKPFRIVSRDAESGWILSISLPVTQGTENVAALLLSTRGGDIEALVSNERRRMVTVFLLVLTVSIGLSMVLAKSIARPLRILASAADQASGSNREMTPERIQFPDLTGRPDEIGDLSRALILMTQALYERIEANEEFAADVAHEIKNPLTSLRSAVETMSYVKTDEQRAKLLAVIEQDVRRLDRLVTDISNASRLDGELVYEQMESFNLNTLLESLVDHNQVHAEKAQATLRAELPDAPVYVSGLEGRLAQVFVNLMTNALSFTPVGGEVVVRVQEKTRETMITIEDNGPGIPHENLDDVFSRFYSERPGQEFGNHSGLGLAISRQIIEAHGGKIWAENILDGTDPAGPRLGARFSVVLPK